MIDNERRRIDNMEAIDWTKRTRSTLVGNIRSFQPGWEVASHLPNGRHPHPYIKVEAGPYRYDVVITENGNMVVDPRDQEWLAPQSFQISSNDGCGPIARRIGKVINDMMRSRVEPPRRPTPHDAECVGKATRTAFENALSRVVDRSTVAATVWSTAAEDIELIATSRARRL